MLVLIAKGENWRILQIGKMVFCAWLTVFGQHQTYRKVMHVLGIIIGGLGAVALLALNVMYIRRYGRFVRYLELNHPEHWKSVGSPVQFEDEPQYGSLGYVAYFANRSYAELGDPELSMLGDKMRGQRKWIFACLGVLVVGVEIVRRNWG